MTSDQFIDIKYVEIFCCFHISLRCYIWSLLFMPSEVMEAVGGQKHYSERTLWHSTQNSVHPTAILEPRPKVLIFSNIYL